MREHIHAGARVRRPDTNERVPVEGRAERLHALYALRYPKVRLAGYLLLWGAVVAHNYLAWNEVDWQAVALIGLIWGAYNGLSWILVRWVPWGSRLEQVGFAFLVADSFFWILAVYCTGADQSWLFFVPIIRVIDQIYTNLWRVIFFSHVATLSYLSMVLYLIFVEGRDLDLGSEAAKMLLIYLACWYISLTARHSEALRARTRRAMRMSQDLVVKLTEKSIELERALKKAKSSTQAKSSFLANMSHELRTPLHGIIGMVDLLAASELSLIQKKWLKSIRGSGLGMVQVVGDILDFSNMESGKVDLHHGQFDLLGLCESCLELVAEDAAEKNLALFFRVDGAMPRWFLGDEIRIGQVLSKLLSNAVKFTKAGEVCLNVRGRFQSSESTVYFEVSDTGIGIPKDRMHALFEPFFQVDASLTREYGGTGLGLAITRQLVDKMGGAIAVESLEGEGSHFRVSLPLESRSTTRMVEVDPSFCDLSIDVCLPDEGECGIVLDYLGAWGAKAQSVSLQEAVTRIHTHARILLLTEHAMREQIGDGLRSRVIGVAAFGTPIDDYPCLVRRPIKPSELYKALSSAVRESLQDAQKESEGAGSLSAPVASILVVEDNIMCQVVAKELLDALGYEAVIVEKGDEAIRAVDERSYAAILMDRQLPDMDGFTATAAIREKGLGSDVLPIIAVTAHAFDEERERAFAAGMDDYLTKPFTIEELERMLHRHVARGTALRCDEELVLPKQGRSQ